ncbi:MAG: D-alanine--D-alanine ligase [Bacteroidales bacterium]|nr:D-alanine--D-alanine ligase [Bacteroidales bacterium]
MKKNIALVMGGYSGEHDISIASGNQVYGQLDHTKYNVYKIVIDRQGWYWLDGEEHRPIDRGNFTVKEGNQTVNFDLAFIIVHGNPGENGVLQGYFDMLGIRYTTCGFYTSALTFQKGYCNPVVKNFGIVKVAKSVLLYSPDNSEFKIQNSELKYPLLVKPAACGSSVATTKVKSPDQLLPAIREAFTEDHAVLVEECIVGREFDCGVFRKADGEKLIFPITEIIPKGGHEFFDYEAKYQGFSNEVTPAEVDERISKHIQEVSSQLYDLLGCKGVVRFDYIHDMAADELYFLEVNTIPGQSAESIVPKQARAIGISPAELYEMSIQAALK